MSQPLIEAKALRKYFRIGKQQLVHAVDEVSLAIGVNEVVGLGGESGSGKTTWHSMAEPCRLVTLLMISGGKPMRYKLFSRIPIHR